MFSVNILRVKQIYESNSSCALAVSLGVHVELENAGKDSFREETYQKEEDGPCEGREMSEGV